MFHSQIMGRNRRRRRGHYNENKDKGVSTTEEVEEQLPDLVINDTKVDNGCNEQQVPKRTDTKNENIASVEVNGFSNGTTNGSLENRSCVTPDFYSMTEQTSRRQPRDYYLHYLCQVCKTLPKPDQREACAECKLVTYCSSEHKKLHWPSHADVCQTLVHLFKKTNFTNITPDDFRRVRVNMMEECEKIVKRSLEKYEREIILYYNRCFYCYERDSNLLQSCETCKHVSFCKLHTIQEEHDKYCPSLVVYRDIVLHIIGDDLVSIYFPDTFAQELKEKDMKTLCSKETDTELESAFLSELATSPLSVLETLKSVYGSYQKVPQSLCIHIIGAENDFELSAIEKWEIFLGHYLKCRDIVLVFIGPELFYEESAPFTPCEECEIWHRKMTMKFYSNTLYHEYVEGSNYLKPDLICSFNPGMYRSTGFNKTDSWQETIEEILHQNVPVLITAYTQVEILKDIKRLEQCAPLKLLQTPCANPFSSMKPFLSFVHDEVSPIIFKNQYLVVIKKF